MACPVSILAAGSVLRVFEPDSPQARAIFNLGMVCTAIFAIIFIIVAGVIVLSLMRFRSREGAPDPNQVTGNKRLEIIWTAIPAVIVLALFVLTARTMEVADPAPAPKPDLVVIGHQWWWEFRYANGVVAVNELHIPLGKPLSLRLDSVDVLHEFWVPELARKMTAVPGHPNHIWLQADRPGTYLGICSEFCGTQHAWMHFLVVAEPQESFDAWIRSQLQPAPAPEGEAAKGLAVFEQFSCASCHAIRGTPDHAQVGPDLTHVASRHELGACIVANNPENLRRWLKNPQEVKPGVLMPNFNLTDEQINELVAYFETLK